MWCQEQHPLLLCLGLAHHTCTWQAGSFEASRKATLGNAADSTWPQRKMQAQPSSWFQAPRCPAACAADSCKGVLAMITAHLAPIQPRPQVKPDTAFLQKIPLWKAFRTCEHKARNKNTKRRANSMSVLRDPEGQRLQFSHADRASIQPSILARIRHASGHAGRRAVLKGSLLNAAGCLARRAAALCEPCRQASGLAMLTAPPSSPPFSGSSIQGTMQRFCWKGGLVA